MSAADDRKIARLRVGVLTEDRLDGPLLDLLALLSGIHDITVHSQGGGAPPAHPARLAESRFRMRPLPALPAAGGGDLPASLPEAAAELEESDVTVLLEDMSAAALLACAVRRRRGGALFLLAHQENHFPRVTPLNPWSRSVRDLVHRSADAIAAVTERARDVLVVEGAAKDGIAVLSPGVDTDRFSPDPVRRADARARLGLRPDERAVVFIGRSTWDEGIFDLLHAAKLLELSDTPGSFGIRYLLFGGGAEAARVRDVIDDLGISSRVRVFEDLQGTADPEIYAGADVLAVPAIVPRSWNHGLGGSVMEAMASGTAVVAADSGSVREIVADSGILVPPADPRALAGGLETLLRDDAKRAEQGARARRRAVERFDGRLAVGVLDETLRSLASRRRGAT